MISKLIMVGCTTQNNKVVNGQSMMFQLFVDKLQERNIKTVIIDFGKSVDADFANKRISGKFSYIKLIDNFFLVFRYFFVLISNSGVPVYINTSQSKAGFLRDYLFINLAKFFGHKVIAHQFGANYDKFYDSQHSSLRQKIRDTFDKTDKLIVEGEYTKNHFQFLTNYKEKVTVIPNGLPENVDSKTITAKEIVAYQPVKIIYLSNLIESKGYWDVLKAFNILVNRDHRNVEVIFSGRFLGDVEDEIFGSAEKAKESFFTYIKENKLSDKVQYFEGLYGENKAKAFREAHFFILPSYYINEGQPVSILESLAYGCVPIVTKHRLIPDMVNEENGFFVNPKSPEEIAKIINHTMNHPLEYSKYSANGIIFYLDNFTADKYFDQLIHLF